MMQMAGSRFQCVDCHVWLEQDYAQVVFGQQRVADHLIGRIGRCQHCGKGLPPITVEHPHLFTKDNRPYKIVLAWEALRQVFTYAVLRGPNWKPVDCFDLSQLREVVASITESDGISEDEVATLKRELYDSSDADLWSRLVKA